MFRRHSRLELAELSLDNSKDSSYKSLITESLILFLNSRPLAGHILIVWTYGEDSPLLVLTMPVRLT